MSRHLFLLTVAVCLAAAQPIAPRAQATHDQGDYERLVQPFLDEHCTVCHGTRRQKGDLNLERFAHVASLEADPALWEHVARKIRTGEMPPEDEVRPDPEALVAVADWIQREVDRIDRDTPPDPGRVTARRLNRAEYNNTVRDLLGVDLQPADDFPQDDAGYGFDNIGDVLSLSPVLMEKYVAAADRIVRTALYGPQETEPTLVRLRTGIRTVQPVKTPPAEYDRTGLSLPNAVHTRHRFPVDGDYMIRVFFGGDRPASSAPVRAAVWIDGEQVKVVEIDGEQEASFARDEQEFGGKTREFRVRVAAGERWVAATILDLYDGLPARYGGANPSSRPEPPPAEFRPPRFNPTPERIAAARKRFEERQEELRNAPVNGVRVSSLEVGGPYNPVTGPSKASLEKIYVCGHLDGAHGEGCPREILTSLARRAYRRPVAAAEVERLLALARLAREQGDSFEEGLAVAMQGLLVSPDFLFRIEDDRPADAKGVHPVSQHELASRLSYFLWASLPDEELRGLADRQRLREPGVLEAQVRRMLADPRSRSLVQEFGGQWLQFRALESSAPDSERFPDFDEYLRMSMRRETELFFERVIREDRPILDFLNGTDTYLNGRLAKHYRIAGVTGPEFRPVSLAGTPRGGVLTQGSVLTVSSYATRTSPVLRGKWVLENLLNAPPPDPPPGTPAIDEAKVGEATTLREQLELHRADPTCAACHRRMDPIGFGLENFDAIGAWRTEDGKFPVDAAGVLPDGRAFRGPDELKVILSGDRDAFTRAIASKLLTYALGRGLEPYDRPTVKAIARGTAANDYRFSALVLEIVTSVPFQMRRGESGS